MKAGTTLLYDLFHQHPDVCMARAKKEVHFFDVHYHRGIRWYESQFDPCGARVAGEITPNYLYDPRCPARIHRHLPDARMIVCLRDPITRAYSQFKQWVRDSGFQGG